MKKLLLIDAHALIHRAYHALPPLTAPDGSPVGALYGVMSMLLKIFQDVRPDFVAAAFDRPEKTFREELFTEYKATRPEADDALIAQLKEARFLFRTFGVPVVERPGVEADDLLGTLAARFGKGLEVIILTGDMDALQLVDDERDVKVLGLKRGVSDMQMYTEAEARGKFGVQPSQIPDYKGLAGDSSDNIPGVRGIGPRGAAALLSKYGTLEGVYQHLYELSEAEHRKLEAGREDARLSRQLALIRRDIPLDLSLSEMAFAPKWDAVRRYLEARGFTSLVKRLYPKEGISGRLL